MWIFLCLLSAVTSGLASIIMKKCSKNNNAKSIALIGLATSNILYITVSILFTDVLTNFSIKNFLYFCNHLKWCHPSRFINIYKSNHYSISTIDLITLSTALLKLSKILHPDACLCPPPPKTLAHIEQS